MSVRLRQWKTQAGKVQEAWWVDVKYQHPSHVPRVKLFKTDKPAFDFLSFEEAERMINAAEPEWRTLILVALKTGLRLGELIGLQWADLDLQRGKLHVRRSWRRSRGGSWRSVYQRMPSLTLIRPR